MKFTDIVLNSLSQAWFATRRSGPSSSSLGDEEESLQNSSDKEVDKSHFVMHVGSWLMRQGDSGVDDPWYHRGHAIHYLLESDDADELAGLVNEAAKKGSAGGGGDGGNQSDDGSSVSW